MPAGDRVVFALACAERVVRDAGAPTDLQDALDTGWSAALGGPGDAAGARTTVQHRADIERDDVAAVFYALGAVTGRTDDAWWAASRALDAAFARSTSVPPKRRFGRRAKSMPDEAVVRELQWQDEALRLLARDGATGGVVQRLRA